MHQPTLQQALQIALHYQHCGRFVEAEAIYREVLAQQPDNSELLHLLGVLDTQAGRFAAAVESIGAAIRINPSLYPYYINLGIALAEAGRVDEAINAYRQALQLQPQSHEAHNNLGNAFSKNGNLNEARAAYQAAIAANPSHPDAHINLGNALRKLGQLDDAIQSYERALQLKPDSPAGHYNLGVALLGQHKPVAAVQAFSTAAKLRPAHPETHYHLGGAYFELGTYDQAIASYSRALQLRPEYPESRADLAAALTQQGNSLKQNGRFEEAIRCYRSAIAFNPSAMTAHYNLGLTLHDRFHLDEARIQYLRAIELNPDEAGAHNNLGNLLKDQGLLDDAIKCYDRAISLQPDNAQFASNRLAALNMHPGYDARSIFEAHRQWNQRHAIQLSLSNATDTLANAPPDPSTDDPDRRLKIGYVSADLHMHPVGRFLTPLFDNHDHGKFEVFAYADVRAPDMLSSHLRKHTDSWRDISGLSDDQVAQAVRRDRIDVLVDLAGHTVHNRLRMFAQKPAPVLVTWLGYANTTGMSAMGYRITDSHADPHGTTEAVHTEQLERLPSGFLCFSPADPSPAVSPLPAIRRGHVTFGSFNTFSKLNAFTVDLWAQVLHRVRGSKLAIKCQALATAGARQHLMDLFAARSIGPDRLEILAMMPTHFGHLRMYDQVDVALDPFPYHGTTTTCDALWMGVPVVSLAGDRHISRVGASLLTNVELEHLVARDAESYVKIAESLAGDRAGLATMRSELRERMRRSRLMDAPRFARDMENAYRSMWRRLCAEQR